MSKTVWRSGDNIIVTLMWPKRLRAYITASSINYKYIYRSYNIGVGTNKNIIYYLFI